MLVKSVNQNVKDVFVGHSWENWVRIDLTTHKILKANFTVKPNLLKVILSKVHH